MTAPSAERCPQKGVKCSCLQRDQYLAVIKANTSTGACGVPRHMLDSPVCGAVPCQPRGARGCGDGSAPARSGPSPPTGFWDSCPAKPRSASQVPTRCAHVRTSPSARGKLLKIPSARERHAEGRPPKATVARSG